MRINFNKKMMRRFYDREDYIIIAELSDLNLRTHTVDKKITIYNVDSGNSKTFMFLNADKNGDEIAGWNYLATESIMMEYVDAY